MQRLVAPLAGGLLGLALGSVLSAHLIASAFGPTPVTWDAASCAPGTYTITATARSLSGPDAYVTTSTSVRLPQPVFIQEFPNLPPGEYSVTAAGQARHGQAFESAPQIVAGLGAWVPVGTRGHRSPLLPQPAAAQPASLAVTPPAAVARQTVSSSASADSSVGTTPTLPELDWLLLMPGGIGDLADIDLRRCRIELLDTDADGIMDIASIEWSSREAWIRVLVDLRRYFPPDPNASR